MDTPVSAKYVQMNANQIMYKERMNVNVNVTQQSKRQRLATKKLVRRRPRGRGTSRPNIRSL